MFFKCIRALFKIVNVINTQSSNSDESEVSETGSVPVDWQNCDVTTCLWNRTRKEKKKQWHVMLWTGKRGNFCSILCEFVIEIKLMLMWDFVVEIGGFPTEAHSFEHFLKGWSRDRLHKWRPKKYSFVIVLIKPTSLALKEHFFCISSVPTRLVSLIGIKRKEY